MGVTGLLEQPVPVVRADVDQIEHRRDLGGVAHAIGGRIGLTGRPSEQRIIHGAFDGIGHIKPSHGGQIHPWSSSRSEHIEERQVRPRALAPRDQLPHPQVRIRQAVQATAHAVRETVIGP